MVRYAPALAVGIISAIVLIFGWTLHHYMKKAAYTERDEILEARAKRDTRRAARRARDEEEYLVDLSNNAGGDAELGFYELREVRNVGVAGNMDEEDGLGGAIVAEDAGGSGAKEVEKEG